MLVELIGCFSDADLPVDAGVVAVDTTPNGCARRCLATMALSISYAGVTGSGGCKCGPERPRESGRKDDLDCRTGCGLGPSRFCGWAAGRYAIYRVGNGGRGE